MMQTANIVRTKVELPVFIAKLWRLVEDSQTDELICWSPKGASFVIKNQTRFAKELLPLYFKHGNMTSFIRQLNMYGFRKIANVGQGGLYNHENEEIEFYHQYFAKDQELLLKEIKRKIPMTKSISNKNKSELIKEIMSDVESIHANQETLDTTINEMKKENEALWRELAILRQKDKKQQKVVEKLVNFLVSILHTNRNIGLKRKIPLMIEADNDKIGEKIPRLNRQLSKDKTLSDDLCGSSAFPVSSNTGPVIHEVIDSPSNSLFPDDVINLSGIQDESVISLKTDKALNEINSDLCSNYLVECEMSSPLDEKSLFDLNDTVKIDDNANSFNDEGISLELLPDKVQSIKNKKKNELSKLKNNNNVESKDDQMQVAISSNNNSLSNSFQNNFADILENISPDLDWFHDLLPNTSLLDSYNTDENLAYLTEFLQEVNNDDIIKGNEITKYSPLDIDSLPLFKSDNNNSSGIENELDVD